jgi:predicted ribosome quality control (RQC) complex YloA/Tae2 family protein
MINNQPISLHDRLFGLKKEVVKTLKHCRRKHEKQLEELNESLRSAWYRQIGDSLMAVSKEIPRGTSKTTLFNVHTQMEEPITLNPKFDFRKNAELFYKKSRKAKHGSEINAKKVMDTEAEIKEFEQLVPECDTLLAKPNDEAIENLCVRIESILSRHSPQSSSSVTPSEKEREKIPYRHFTIGEWNIYTGKSDTQNDDMTTRFAKPQDLWLHVAGHAGSHILIRRPDRTMEVPKDIIEKAAALAVWFSKAKHTSYAEVHVTEARFVHKRRHSPAGQVIAERCKAVRVSPRSPQELFPAQYDEKTDQE